MTLEQEFENWFTMYQSKHGDTFHDKTLAKEAWVRAIDVAVDRMTGIMGKPLTTTTGE